MYYLFWGVFKVPTQSILAYFAPYPLTLAMHDIFARKGGLSHPHLSSNRTPMCRTFWELSNDILTCMKGI